jgi:uncharacterized protein
MDFSLRGMVAPILWTAGAAVAVYVAALGWLWFQQERLLFFPERLPQDHVLAREPDVHEGSIEVPGARLSTLHLRLPNPHGVMLFLHGNGGNLSGWFINPSLFREANFDLFMLDYRGYGKSTGRIESEAQLHADVRAAWETIAPQYVGKRVVIYGRSLGTALAARLAAELQPDLTVLVSPYRSMAALTAEFYPWVPQALLRYPLRTEDDVAKIRSPLLLVHGGQDTLIAPRHSHALHRVAPHAQALHVPQAGHNDLQDFEAYVTGLASALAAAAAAPGFNAPSDPRR